MTISDNNNSIQHLTSDAAGCTCDTNRAEVKQEELMYKLDLLLRTGSILMESNADTSRIMRNMKRTAASGT